ncbi:olfactory receptor 6Z7-like [Callithrix jacchus]|uniref:olfactory receptor 5-like n=1 Tax=Callithrix jacchus TaxID=9483 RepID=UPI0001D38DB7|nr:olfactory receptor 5-like [Callithrix jacchus]XP_054106514.1 olfactory receptor 5-like [Callithrix jacchus]
MERSPELANMSGSQDFILLGLSARQDVREALFVLFLTLYLLTLLENTLVLHLVRRHSRLRKPMYFFLGNLSGLELCYVSVTVPSLFVGLWTGPCRVSFAACIVQLFFFLSFMGTKCTLLAAMAYDRYVAICRPLRYPLLMRPQRCQGLALTSWVGGLLVSVAKTTCMASLPYCGPRVLHHFFCDAPPLLHLSCAHATLKELVGLLSGNLILGGSVFVALASYVAIGGAVLRLPSAAARRKALCTCASHLAVMGLFYAPVLFVHSRPSRLQPTDFTTALSVLYTVGTPACSPVIYCLRNAEVRVALRGTLCPGRVSVRARGFPLRI